MDRRQIIGSFTAIGGFENEANIALKFINYKNDNEAQIWLEIMGYDYKKVQNIKATKIPPRISKKTAMELGVLEDNIEESSTFKKADIQVRLEIIVDEIYHIENISLKKANSDAGYNQVDKRSVDKYKSIWSMPLAVAETLKYYTGELKVKNNSKLKDKRRMFLHEMPEDKVKKLLCFFEENKILIFNDVLRGRGALSADWFLVTKKDNKNIEWILKDINFVCNFFAQGAVVVNSRGNLKIGKMTAQRKGGTPDPESLQFKLNPLELFKSLA